MNKNGFSLLEFLVYFMLLSFLATTIFSWLAHSHHTLKNRSRQATELLQLYAAHDVLVRDLRAAPALREHWKKIHTKELIWHVGNHDVGWRVEDKKLLRLEGRYDAEKQQWMKKTKSVVADKVAAFVCLCEQGNAAGYQVVERVDFEIQKNGAKKIKGAVTLKNRIAG